MPTPFRRTATTATVASSRRRWRAVGWLTLYSLYLLLWLVVVHYVVFWRPFVAKMRERAVPPWAELPVPAHMEPRTMERLGSFSPDRRTCFANFPETKAEGVRRVCAFGDSFTYGAEVADGHDYPALLQEMFRRAGFDRVEVLSFASTWHGFHQSYVVWDEVGRHYDCDDILLGPASFQYERDSTFNHSGYKSPYYLHARYVLDGDDVRLVEVPGRSYAERFADYFRFLPRWQYLRYDRNLAPSLQSILPENRSLPNPLYYDSESTADEALAIYGRLLRKLAKDAPHVVLLHDNERLTEVAKRLGLANLVAAKAFATTSFPYRAPDSHYSSFGNQMVARQFFGQLVDSPAKSFALVETSDPPRREVAAMENSPRPLSSYDRIELRAGEQPIADLVPAIDEPNLLGSASASILKQRNVAGLLALRVPSRKLVESVYAEIDFILRDGEAVELRATDGSQPRVPLGKIRLLDPTVNVGVLDLDDVSSAGFAFIVGAKSLRGNSLPPAGTPIELWVGDDLALRGTAESRSIRLEPKGQARHFRVSAGQFADLEAMGAEQFDLVLQDAENATRVPLATWKRSEVPMPHAE